MRILNYRFKTKSVCSSEITFDIDGDIITNIKFTGGCNGNLKALARVLDGYSVSKIEELLKGNTCGFKQTSCGDQLAKAVRQAYDEINKKVK